MWIKHKAFGGLRIHYNYIINPDLLLLLLKADLIVKEIINCYETRN